MTETPRAAAASTTRSDRLSTFAFVAGLLSVLIYIGTRVAGAAGVLGDILIALIAIAGVVLAIVALTRHASGRGTAIAALVLSGVTLFAPFFLDSIVEGFVR